MLLILTSLFACGHSDRVNILIENQSGFAIDSLSVHPNTAGLMVELQPGDSVVYTADLSRQVADGAYSIIYRNVQNGKVYRDTFGYFTNGMALEREIRYRIVPPE
ncbi:hypothetical protein CRP01_16580 [Flavilitoribacter nigricans DSM 23189 = NBRC 102662]|uniref:Uncharacterized protein n=1 Tax=Flavilitoribacter nigricans (strain ATCC 23147 / DSM 23189 / NBRC 102662 / NCIMB 1420 / SS-2) TaxID=1122177 RepID=A0A2D0NCV4_FLAN2|nr:hypothetical protein CRP01_16580 [Flavilitoribacter nigricans DSM 23189 = NBRC 102662]